MSEGRGPTGIEKHQPVFSPDKGGAGSLRGGTRGEELAGWLIKPEEYKELKPSLKPLVEIIGGRPDEANTPDRLNNDRDRLEGLVLSGQAKLEDIRPFLQRIDAKIADIGAKKAVERDGVARPFPEAARTPLGPGKTPEEVHTSILAASERQIGKQPVDKDRGDDTMDDRNSPEQKARLVEERSQHATAIGPSLAEQMGIMPPEEQLDIVYRPIERRGQIAMNVAQPLSFEVMFDDERHLEMPETEAETQHECFRIRFSNLLSGAAQKATAGSVDSVMSPVPEAQQRLDPMGVEFKKADLEFLYRNQPGVLQAKSIWTTIIGGPEYVGPNPPDIREKLLNFFLKKYGTNKEQGDDEGRYREALEELGFSRNEIKTFLDSGRIKARAKVEYRYDRNRKEEERFSITKDLVKDFAHELWYIKHLVNELGFSKEEAKKLLKQRQSLLEGKYGCPPSFWTADEPNFERVRDSVQFWLKTEGRDNLYLRRMVPTKDESGNPFGMRSQKDWKSAQEYIQALQAMGVPSEQIKELLEETRLSKQLSLKELEGLAKDAEQTAWNFTFTVGLVESFNTEEACWALRHRAGSVKGPSNHMTLYLWMALHPVQRWTAKIMTAAKEIKDKAKRTIRLAFNLKENWSSLGVWATNNIARMSQSPSTGMRADRAKPWTLYRKVYVNEKGDIKSRLVLVTPKFLRPDLVKDGLRQENGNKEAFFDSFTEIGSKLLNNPREFKDNDAVCDNLFDRSAWENLNNTPFVNYRFDYLRWGLTIYTLFKKGINSVRDVAEEDMQEAFYRLDLSMEERIALLMARTGINNRKLGSLGSSGGKLGFSLYLTNLQLSREYGLGNLFKNQEVGKPVETKFDWSGYPGDEETREIIEGWRKSRVKINWQ